MMKLLRNKEVLNSLKAFIVISVITLIVAWVYDNRIVLPVLGYVLLSVLFIILLSGTGTRGYQSFPRR